MSTYGDAFNAAVAAELRGQRARTRMTVDQVATETGFAKSTVLNYLNGKRDIPIPALADLCRVMNIDARSVFEAAEKALDNS